MARLPSRPQLARLVQEWWSWLHAAFESTNPTTVLLTYAVWAAVVGCLVGGMGGCIAGRVLHVPKLDLLETMRPAVATRIIGGDDSQVGVFATEQRIELPPEAIPNHLKLAVVAAEDERFYEHIGVDPRSLARAVWGSVATRRFGGRGGGSTITQQLALNLFLERKMTLRRKLREGLLAIDMEKRLSKDEILTRYANQIYFGRGAYGVEAASRLYFGLSATELDLAQAATLAAIIPSPERKFNPSRRPDAVLDRRNRMLTAMLELEFITAEQHQQATAQPLGVSVHARVRGSGGYYLEMVRQHIQQEYGTDNLYSGGLEVRTTMDPVLQSAADWAVREGLVALDMRLGVRRPANVIADELAATAEEYDDPTWRRPLEPGGMVRAVVTSVSAEQAQLRIDTRAASLARSDAAWTGARSLEHLLRPADLVLVRLPETLPETADEPLEVELLQEPSIEGALVVLDNSTGAILALTGGFDATRSEFNRAVQARRQCGSAFKPFVYLTAFENGYTPADSILDAPFLLPDASGRLAYCPKNFYPTYYGMTTLRGAVEASHNASAVKLQHLVGGEAVIELAHRLGIESELLPYPSLALGSMDVLLIELTRAYTAIANLGELPDPYFIESVRDRDGTLLYQNVPRLKRVLSQQVAFLMAHVLRGVVDRGTARAAAKLDLDLGGKTGTTDAYTDAWFVGFSPRITVGVWVGRDLKETIGRNMSGGSAALPIWIRFMERYIETLTEEERGEQLPAPYGIVFAAVDHDTGLRATPDCGPVILEAFLAGTEPAASCSKERHAVAELPWPFQLPLYSPWPGEPLPSAEAMQVADNRLRNEFNLGGQ